MSHTGMVQPSGPSNHFWSSFGSVCARYTASGGAAKRRVTTTCVSPSVFSVILLIVFLLFSFPSRPTLRPTGRNFSPELCGAWQATGPWLQYRRLRDAEAASRLPRGGRSVPHPQAPSGAARLLAASSRTASLIHLRSLPLSP